MRAVFLDLATYKPDVRHPALLQMDGIDWVFHDSTAPEKVVSNLAGADILVCNKVKITQDVMDQLPDLKLIVAGATGVDNIDVQAARKAGIEVCNVRGYSTLSVAQHAFMLMLALSGSLISYNSIVQNGAWQAAKGFNLLEFPLIELSGKTLGIIGYGAIGQAAEKIAKAFGMQVLVADRKGEDSPRNGRVSFDDILEQSDFLSIHCPLNDKTRGMIGGAELSRMKNSSFIINVSRGGIIDEAALFAALKSGDIAGAGLDVLSNEPPRDGNILLDKSLPNLIITPHCAWASEEARLRMFLQIAEVVKAFHRGVPINSVI